MRTWRLQLKWTWLAARFFLLRGSPPNMLNCSREMTEPAREVIRICFSDYAALMRILGSYCTHSRNYCDGFSVIYLNCRHVCAQDSATLEN